MLELAIAAAFFTVLALITIARDARPRPLRAKVSPMRATLERRIRDGADFTP